MARQKTVFKNDEITEVFVKQSQDFGRVANSSFTGTPSMYFEKNVMYSYGTHFTMGILDNNVLLIAKRESSATTNKHLSNLGFTAQKAGITVIEVDDVHASDISDHDHNVADLMKQAGELRGKAQRARKQSYIDMYLRDADKLIDQAVAYRKHFGLNVLTTADFS